jgi:hypothetical protein
MFVSNLKKAVPFIAVIILIIGISAVNDYFRSKRVKPSEDFIAKVQLAETEIMKVELDNFIKSETTYNKKSTFGFGVVCTRGSYQTQTTSGNGTWCKKGFSRFYGLSSIDKTEIKNLYDYYLKNNWQPFGESGLVANLEEAVLNLNDRVGIVYFKNKDGVLAQLSIARTDMKRPSSLCTSTLCQLADQHKRHAAVAEVSIYYESRPF